MPGPRHIAPLVVRFLLLIGAVAPSLPARAEGLDPPVGDRTAAAARNDPHPGGVAAGAPPGARGTATATDAPAPAEARGAAMASEAEPDEGLPPEEAGLASPDGEAWGDEWFDERAREEAAAFERKLLEEAVGAAAPQPAAPPTTEAEAKEPPPAPARVLVPPRHGPADLLAAWRHRREALLRQDRATAAAAEGRLFEWMRELDVREVHALGAAALRESRKLEASAPAEALARARLALRLAPSLPAVHVQHLRARFAHDPFDVAGLASAAAGAIRAFLADARSMRLLALDLGAAAALAVLAAGGVVLLLLATARGRAVLHDFHHLFPRGISPVQTALLAGMLLLLPLVAGLGPAPVAGLLVAALWMHLERAERIVLGAWIALVCLLPLGGAHLAASTVWDGTPAAALQAVDRDGDFPALATLAERVASGDADPETLFVVARARKRTGALAEARRLYERALEARPAWPEALVNLGNVRFLEGDLDEAEELYTRAIDLDPALAAAYFDLSRVHYDRLDLGPGQEARARAVELDPALAERYVGGEGPVPANAWLVDLPIGDEALAALADRAGAAEGERVGAALAAALFGPVPAHAAPLAGAGLLALLLLAPLMRARRRRPAAGCVRCGRPVCAACDPEAAGGAQCGQCLNVFEHRARVDEAARERKERAVRVHGARRALWRRAAAVAFAGAFVGGAAFRGAILLLAGWFLVALVLLPAGLVEPLHGGLPVAWKLAILAPPLTLCAVWTWRAAEES